MTVSTRRAVRTGVCAVLTIPLVVACAARRVMHEDISRDDATRVVPTLRERVAAFAHDSTLGRLAGSATHNKATDYLALQAKRIGLLPAGEGGTYFQVVPLSRREFSNASLLRVDNADSVTLWRDIVPFMIWRDPVPMNGARMIYAGRTTDSLTLTADDVRGKIVLFAAPTGTNGGSVRSYPPNHPLSQAAAIATTNVDNILPGIGRRSRVPFYGIKPETAAPQPSQFLLSKRGAELLMGAKLADMRVGQVGNVVEGELRYTTVAAPSRNVIGVLRGSDPRLRDEYVVISAHSDHLGVAARAVDHDSVHAFQAALRRLRVANGDNLTDEQYASIKVNVDSLRRLRPARRDSISNGADDDASGSMALLTIAEELMKHPPGRSVLFVWHTGEELGMVGSRWLTDHPVVPLSQIVSDINLDMIGRGSASEEPHGGDDYVEVIGSRRLSPDLGALVEEANRASAHPMNLRYEYDAPGHPQGLYCRSDHAMYARFGIPVAFFTTGMHGDYHQVTDEAAYLDYAKLSRVALLAADVVRGVANRDARPEVTGVKPNPQGGCEQ